MAPLVFNSHQSRRQAVIVVEPTVALIQDNIMKLNQFVPELSAIHLTPATVTRSKVASYIFTSPEMLLSEQGRENILTDTDFMSTISVIFIDECHIVEEW